MKHTFKALLLQGVFILVPALSGFTAFSQDYESYNLEGFWTFKRAEYLELPSPNQGYQLKYSIDKIESLFSLNSCFQDVIGEAFFYNNEIAKISCMHSSYIGKYIFPVDPPSAFGEEKLMIFGDHETIGQASPIEDMIFNAPQIEYLLEYLDSQTISITIKRSCYENGATIQGAVKCILMRESSNTY